MSEDSDRTTSDLTMRLPCAPRLLISLLLCLLLCQLPLSQTEGSTDEPALTASPADDLNASSAPGSAPAGLEQQNATLADCLVDNQSGVIALGSAGALIVCLLVAVVTLACQVHHLQRRSSVPRSSSRSAGFWADAAPERGAGGAGPCHDGVMLQEVTSQEELGRIREEEEDEDEGEKPLMSRDSCSDLPRDLEDMPLVV